MTLLTYLFILVFLIGLFFYSKGGASDGFTTRSPSQPRCPNLLIQKGSRFYLYNSKLAQVPGVNPVEFDNLETNLIFNLFLFITNLYNQEFQIMRILHAPNNRVIA